MVGAVDQKDRRSCVLDVLRLRARQVRIPYEIPADELRKSPEDGLGVAEVVVLLDAVRSVDAPQCRHGTLGGGRHTEGPSRRQGQQQHGEDCAGNAQADVAAGRIHPSGS